MWINNRYTKYDCESQTWVNISRCVTCVTQQENNHLNPQLSFRFPILNNRCLYVLYIYIYSERDRERGRQTDRREKERVYDMFVCFSAKLCGLIICTKENLKHGREPVAKGCEPQRSQLSLFVVKVPAPNRPIHHKTNQMMMRHCVHCVVYRERIISIFKGTGVFFSHTREGYFEYFCWNFGLNNDNCFKTFTKIMKLTLCGQRRKIINIPINILSSVYAQHNVLFHTQYHITLWLVLWWFGLFGAGTFTTKSGEFAAQRPVTRIFDVLFDLHVN